MTPGEAFDRLYADLPREGPGDRATLDRALALGDLPRDGRICDAGCGSGADLPGLLAEVPDGQVVAIDRHAPFVDRIAARYRNDPRVEPVAGDMADIGGPFDAIWCAGALYFVGLREGLSLFADHLLPGGTVAFSYPSHFARRPSEAACAFWGEDATCVSSADDIDAAVRAAGLAPLDAWPLGDAAWTTYYTPLQARVDALRARAPDPALAAVLDAAEAEAAAWAAVKEETGYRVVVARRP